MKDINKKLSSLSTEKLIDVVKNYKQYGYEEKVKELALSKLNERGYDIEYLKKLETLTIELFNRQKKASQNLIKIQCLLL